MIGDDVSPMFVPNETDRDIIREVLELEGRPEAVRFFDKVALELSDYAYWFVLGTLWVADGRNEDLALWRRLFRSDRRTRQASLMKPSELKPFRALPGRYRAYRAHRAGETDWISYSLSPAVAIRFALERGIDEVKEYDLRRDDTIALFLRRGEREVIVLEKHRATFRRVVPLVFADEVAS